MRASVSTAHNTTTRVFPSPLSLPTGACPIGLRPTSNERLTEQHSVCGGNISLSKLASPLVCSSSSSRSLFTLGRLEPARDLRPEPTLRGSRRRYADLLQRLWGITRFRHAPSVLLTQDSPQSSQVPYGSRVPSSPRRGDRSVAASDLANQDLKFYAPIQGSPLSGTVVGNGARFAIA
jgi:hypothetical protein